jgi:flagellar basal-body rod protein FlgB
MFGKINLLKSAMDASWLKTKAISNNIANANTPNYKRETVEFDSVLKSYIGQGSSGISMKKTNTNHIDIGGFSEAPSISVDGSSEVRKDGNSVDIDTEMAADAENTIQYNYLSKQISDEFRRIRLAIRDGR